MLSIGICKFKVPNIYSREFVQQHEFFMTVQVKLLRAHMLLTDFILVIVSAEVEHIHEVECRHCAH